MPLSAGARLGPYEILSVLGVGGMGEVYRARDAKLNRDVAIKVLLPAVANDPDRMARFSREAQVLASLNHPNIAAIYGLEDAATVRAIVMELVDGPTLAERIAQGAIPTAEALAIAKQIADALEAAHEQGIVHRDLKPANIKVRRDGTVKVLDFGLAKAIDPAASSGVNAMNSPTLTAPTLHGVVLGTAAYMSPEQAAGKAVDRRSDLWAFGVVLMEMLTGRPVFTGETVSHVLAAVLRAEPDWTTLPAETPAPVRKLLRRCLEKDRKRRLDSAADARLEIEDAMTAPAPEAIAPATGSGRLVPATVAALFAGALIAALITWFSTRPSPQQTTRLTISGAGAADISITDFDRNLAITPDGTRVVYVGAHGTQLFVRALDQLEPLSLVSGSPRGVFVSPDGRWVGYVQSAGALRKVPISGGPAVAVLNMDGSARGATWLPDDTIVFATLNATTGLQRASAAGGAVTVLTRPDHEHGEADHMWPEALPGGRAVLFTIISAAGGLDAAQIAVLDLATGTVRTLLRGGTHARYVPSGHLVYAAAGRLHAVPFNLAHLAVEGPSVPVVPQVVTTTHGGADFDIASNGTMVYTDAAGGGSAGTRFLTWVDRQGREQLLDAPPRAYTQVQLSPDGNRVATYITEQELDLWIWDIPHSTLTRLTSEPGPDLFPLWMPDGRRIVYSAQQSGIPNLFWRPADGSGPPERLTQNSTEQQPTGIAPDGTRVIFHQSTATNGTDLMMLTLASRTVTPLLSTPFNETQGVISPDGRWLAYTSNSSGRSEVYVRPFPDVGTSQSQVSVAGGSEPLWAHDGRELFYVAPNSSVMAVSVAKGNVWNAGTPQKIVQGPYVTSPGGESYDVSRDNQRFLTIKPTADPGAPPPQIVVVQHWFEELKRLVPLK